MKTELFDGGFDVGLLVGNGEVVGGVGVEEMGGEVGENRWAAAVLVFPAVNTVRDGKHADGGGLRGGVVSHGRLRVEV